MQYILVGLGVAALLGLYLWSYTLNQNTEKPEGTEDISCKGCNATSCVERKDDIK